MLGKTILVIDYSCYAQLLGLEKSHFNDSKEENADQKQKVQALCQVFAILAMLEDEYTTNAKIYSLAFFFRSNNLFFSSAGWQRNIQNSCMQKRHRRLQR